MIIKKDNENKIAMWLSVYFYKKFDIIQMIKISIFDQGIIDILMLCYSKFRL